MNASFAPSSSTHTYLQTATRGVGGVPLSFQVTVSGAGFTDANGVYGDDGTTTNGQSVYRRSGENWIAYQGNGAWILFYEDDPYYQGGSSATPDSTSGAWTSFSSSLDPAPTLTISTATGGTGTGGGNTQGNTHMGERASVFEKPRLGIEAASAPGTPVPANLILQSLTLTPKPVLVRNPIKASGVSRPVGVTSAKGHTEFSYDASLCYNDLAVLLSSVLCRPTATVVTSGVTSLTYKPAPDQANTLSTFTVQNGSPNGASSFPGAWINDLTITFSKNESKLSGNGMGRRLDDDITLTASPTNLPLVPIEPDTVEIRVADTYSALATGSNKLTRCSSVNWSITGRQTGIITLDPAQGSFSGSVERNHDMAAQVVLNLDSQGIALMDRYREEQIFWVRYIATGPNIVSGQPYSFQISYPCYASTNQRSDVDDAYAGTFDLVPIAVMDGSFNSYTEIILHVPTATATAISTEGTGNTGYIPTVAEGEAASDTADTADGVTVMDAVAAP